MDSPDTKRMQPEQAADAAALRFLEARKVSFYTAGASLRMTIEDEACWLKVSVLRAFPLSEPTRYYSVRDGAGKEIGLLTDIEALDAGSRKQVEAELERRYMISIIHRVVAIKERFGTVDWEVETNRGRSRFTTRDLRDNVLRPAPGHFILNDVENNRYEVPNLDALDSQSQNWLLRHL